MYLKLHLTPAAKRDQVTRVSADKFAISVKEKAEGNMANKKALDILAEYLGVRAASIRIVSGHHAPHKIISIRDH
jgi:uncharacterized protein YggU (UPF0235/DUF167 family)